MFFANMFPPFPCSALGVKPIHINGYSDLITINTPVKATGYGLDDLGSISGRNSIFMFVIMSLWVLACRQPSFQFIGASFPGIKPARAWSWLLTSGDISWHLVLKLRMQGALPPLTLYSYMCAPHFYTLLNLVVFMICTYIHSLKCVRNI
jgi:hypothetical protein